MLNNPFTAVVVRLQTELGQRVVDAGPSPMAIGLALWLESYPAAIAAIVPLALLVVRAHFEEKFLLRSLPGYAPYMQRVRYRFIPFFW